MMPLIAFNRLDSTLQRAEEPAEMVLFAAGRRIDQEIDKNDGCAP